MLFMFVGENGWSGWLICEVHENYKHAFKFPGMKLWILYSKVIFRGTRAVRLLVTTRTLDKAIRERGEEANCHTRAMQYVNMYHAERTDAFTAEEEVYLMEYVAKRFFLFEDTSAEIISFNMPKHRRRSVQVESI